MIEADARPQPSRADRTRALIQRGSQLERSFYASIWRAIRRRPAVAPGGTGFGFHRALLPILIVFIALSALELAILDLVLQRWLAVRIVVDALDAWALVWQIGLLCAFLMHPHVVGRSGVDVRNGLGLDVHLDWDQIAAVKRGVTRTGTKEPRVAEVDGVRELVLRSQGETNVRIELLTPVSVSLPAPATDAGDYEVERIRLWADDPDAFVRAAQEQL